MPLVVPTMTIIDIERVRGVLSKYVVAGMAVGVAIELGDAQDVRTLWRPAWFTSTVMTNLLT